MRALHVHHPAVDSVRDEDVAHCVHRRASRVIESAADRDLSATTGGNLYDPVVVGIRYEEVARSIDRHTEGGIQTTVGNRGLGAATSRKLQYPVVAGVCNEDIARSIHRHTSGH